MKGLFASLQTPDSKDARYGSGQYFTDLHPVESTFLSRSNHSRALFNTNFAWGSSASVLVDVVWIAFRLEYDMVENVSPLYLRRVAHRSIFLRRSELTLDPFDLLDPNIGIIGWGPQTFLLNNAGD